jgi:hypothetical protein
MIVSTDSLQCLDAIGSTAVRENGRMVFASLFALLWCYLQ